LHLRRKKFERSEYEKKVADNKSGYYNTNIKSSERSGFGSPMFNKKTRII